MNDILGDTAPVRTYSLSRKIYLPIVEHLFFLISKVPETIPLSAALSIERDLVKGI